MKVSKNSFIIIAIVAIVIVLIVFYVKRSKNAKAENEPKKAFDPTKFGYNPNIDYTKLGFIPFMPL